MARLQRLASLGGLIGPFLFAAVVSGLTLTQYDFMRGLGWDPLRAPTFDWPSGLALGPYGARMTATFILSGLLMSFFALGLCRALMPTPSAKIGASLLTLTGLAVTGLAFTTDPTIRSTPATWHGRLHDLSFILLRLTLLPAMLALGYAFRRDDHRKRLSVYTWATAALAIPTFIVKGLTFYIFLLAVLVWSEIIGLWLFRTLDARQSR